MPHPHKSVHAAPRFILLGVLALAGLGLGGCATVTRGVHEALVVESEPSGASVKLSTGDVGTTPTSFRIRRRGALDVTISKEGYEVVHVHVATQIAGWGAAGMAGNVLVGGVIGVGVDAFSGGTLEHKPNPIRVNLVPLRPPEPTPAPPAPSPPPAGSPSLPPPSPSTHQPPP
jgi:PEGA domain